MQLLSVASNHATYYDQTTDNTRSMVFEAPTNPPCFVDITACSVRARLHGVARACRQVRGRHSPAFGLGRASRGRAYCLRGYVACRRRDASVPHLETKIKPKRAPLRYNNTTYINCY